MLNKLKIGTKLTLGFAIVLLLLLAMTGFVVYSYSSISKSSTEVLGMFETNNRAGLCIQYANQMRRHFLIYLSTPSDELSRLFDEEFKNTDDIISGVAANSPLEANREEAKKLLIVLGGLKDDKDNFVRLDGVIDEIRATCTGIANSVRDDLAKLGDELYIRFQSDTKTDADGEKVIVAADMDLEVELYKAQLLVGQVLLYRDNFVYAMVPARQEYYKGELFATMGLLKDKLGMIRNHPALPRDFVAQFDAVMANRVTWENTAVRYIATIEEQRTLQQPLLDKLLAIMAGVTQIQTNVGEATAAVGQAQANLVNQSRMLSISIATVAIIFGVVISLVLTRNITTGLNVAKGLFERVAVQGDLTAEVPPEYMVRQDEIGDLARGITNVLKDYHAVNDMGHALANGDWSIAMKAKTDMDSMNIGLEKMIVQVNHALGEISEGVQQVTTGSGEVSNASTALSSGAQESAASLEEITASMSEISGQTKINAESATQARDLAQQASRAAENGQEAMKDMTASMEQITNNSNEIQRVIKVIDDIAFQTNLLALNAAVEAARAGQHGKGFAVVAEEVRNLASRSAKAARETSDLIAKSGQEIERGAEVANRTAEVLNEIVDQIKKTTDLVAGIAVASNEQAQGVNQVSIGLQQIDSVTQQNTAAAEESASAASEMSSMASKLQELVSRFKLRSQSGKPAHAEFKKPEAHVAAPPKPAAAPAKPAVPAKPAAPAPAKPAAPAPAKPATPKPAAPAVKPAVLKKVDDYDHPATPIAGDNWGGGGGGGAIHIDLDSKDFGKF